MHQRLIGQSPRVLQGNATDRATLDRIRAELSAGRSVLAELISPLFNAEGRTPPRVG